MDLIVTTVEVIEVVKVIYAKRRAFTLDAFDGTWAKANCIRVASFAELLFIRIKSTSFLESHLTYSFSKPSLQQRNSDPQTPRLE
jgi:hypothetical protein